MKHKEVWTIFSFIVVIGLFFLQTGAEQFPIGGMPMYFHKTGCDYPIYQNQISDVKELGINIIWTSTKNMLNWAADSGLQVIYFGNNWNMKPNNWNYGQYAKYESDKKAGWPYDGPPFYGEIFSHTSVIGEEVPDQYTENGFAWWVGVNEYSAGWAQRDLIVNYQQDKWWWDIDFDIEYTAKFRLKVDYNEDPIPVAELYAVAEEGGAEEIIAQHTIYADDFINPNSYQYFDLDFILDTSGVTSSNITKKITVASTAKKSSDLPTMDYRIYWYGYVDMWIDRIEIYDYKSEPLLSGNYDSEIQSDLNYLSSYSTPYRLSIRDEPCEDNFPVSVYIKSFIENAGYKGVTDALPEYAQNEWTHEAPDYETYLDEYHHHLSPEEYLFNHLTYQDQYWNNPRLDGLFYNLEVLREKSLANNKEFFATVYTFGWDEDRMDEIAPNLTYAEVYDQIRRRMHASFFTQLAYGAKGIHWWNIYHGLYSSRYGTTRTPYWYYAKEANDIAHFLADHLINITSTNAFATGFDDIPGNSFITGVSEDSIVVGTFEHDSTGQIYFMLVNPRWYAGGEKTFTIEFDCDGFGIDHYVEDILATSAPWNSDTTHDVEIMLEVNENGKYNMTETLDAGEGRLYRILDIAPGIPQNFNGTWYNNHPKIYWTANTEPDFDHYEVWKKTNTGAWALRTTTTATNYTDNSEFKWIKPQPGYTVYYKVRAVDSLDYTSGYTSEESFRCNAPQIDKEKDIPVVEIDPIPTEFCLYAVYPNPFNITTTLKLDLPEETKFSLAIWDIKGSVVWRLNNLRYNTWPAGCHRIVWDGRDNTGAVVPTGVYFIVYHSREHRLSQKVVLMK